MPAPTPTTPTTPTTAPAPAPDGLGDAPSPRRHRVACVLLFALALGLRLLYLGQLADTPYADERRLVADAAYYDQRGAELAAGDLVGDAPGYLSPVMCGLVGTAYALGADLAGAKVLQAVLGALSCLLVYGIGRRAFGWTAGVVAGAGLALCGPHVFYTGLLLPATLVVFLNLAVLRILVGGPPSVPRWLAAGVVLGLAIGTKANALLLLPALAAWTWLAFRASPPGRRLAWCAVLAAGAVAAVAPITWANHRASGEFVLVTTTGGRNFLKGNGPAATGTHVYLGASGTNLAAYLQHRVDVETAVREDREMRDRAVEHVLEHPGRALVLFLTKLGLFFDARELYIRDDLPFARERFPLLRVLLPFGLIAPPALVALLAAWRRRPAWPLLVVLACQVLSIVLVFVLERYRLVALALLLPLAAWQLLAWIADARARRWSALGRGAALLALAAALVHLPVPGFSAPTGHADQHRFLAEAALEAGDPDTAEREYERAFSSEWSNPVDEQWVERGRAQAAQRVEELRRRLRRQESAPE